MREVRVPYEAQGRRFEGAIVYDGNIARARPALFMQPNWYGVCDRNIAQAGTLAGRDFVVLLADMFGADYSSKTLGFAE